LWWHRFLYQCNFNGFDDIPVIDDTIREALNRQFKEVGIESLQQKLKELDEETYNAIDIHNTQRVIRASRSLHWNQSEIFFL
jgi:tRNA A37 N6-isopentenylltransferase MiaA